MSYQSVLPVWLASTHGSGKGKFCGIDMSPKHTKTNITLVMCVRTQSVMPDSLGSPWTAAHQFPPSMEIPRQEYWSRLPFLPPGDLPDLNIEPTSLVSPALAGRFFTTVSRRKSWLMWIMKLWELHPYHWQQMLPQTTHVKPKDMRWEKQLSRNPS